MNSGNLKASEQNIKLGQTLHGYADGHQLLAGSLKVSKPIARLMNLLSDLSGPEVVSGFDSYLTGYPLNDISKYALAHTWYAPEMKRPGCVWTHTLLIDFADLAQINDLAALLPHFKRPEKDKVNWLENYQHPITFNLTNSKHITELNRETPFNLAFLLSGVDVNTQFTNSYDVEAISLLRELYERPKKVVALFASASESYQQLVLSIWSQQWPRLRRSFSFITGALSLKRASSKESKRFDLQIYPLSFQKQVRHFLRTDNHLVVAELNDHPDLVEWLVGAAGDLKYPHNSRLRNFLWRYGVYANDGRAAFAPLVQIFTSFLQLEASHATKAQILEKLELHLASLAALFPEPEQERDLKAAVFGEELSTPKNRKTGIPAITESLLLTALTSTPHYAAFDSSALNITRRAISLMEIQRDEAIALADSLLRADYTPISKDYLNSIVGSLNSKELVMLAKHDIGFATKAISLNPSLALGVDLWRQFSSERSHLLAHFYNCLEDKNLDALVPVLLRADANDLPKELSDFVSPQVLVDSFLEWFNHTETNIYGTPKGWEDYLQNNRSDIIHWLQSHLQPLELELAYLLVDLFNPHDNRIIQLGAILWEKAANSLDVIQATDLRQKRAAFLLALGFHNPSPSGALLAARAYPHIYTAARDNQLDYYNWNLIREQAPADWFWEDWDKCARLTCALIEHFSRYDWPMNLLGESTKNNEMWRKARQFSRRRASWYRYVCEAQEVLQRD